jgi:predicted TIM-barrel fold metal-dependent hydrolase
MPIADAHQHFWDPRVNYHPWLCDEPPVEFRYGDYSALRRPYLPADYFSDARGHEVVKTVYVETEWNPRDPLGETAWVERLRRESGFPTVMVAQAWLDREDAAHVSSARRHSRSCGASGTSRAAVRCAMRTGARATHCSNGSGCASICKLPGASLATRSTCVAHFPTYSSC